MNKITFIVLSVFACINTLAQTPGTLDSTFNGNGQYVKDFGFQDNVNDITVQPDKKIVCTGVALTPAFAGVLKVLRLLPDGTPDSAFASNGVYSFLTGNETYGYESYVQPDGKIVVAGITYDINYNADWLLLRLTPTGVLDTTFGNNGITMVDFFTRDDFAQALTLQPDGKILVSGTFTDTTNYYSNPVIVRFTTSGMIDSTFGVNGIVSVPVIAGDNELTSIVVQTDGKIVAGGHYAHVLAGSDDFDVMVVRADSTGILDASFGLNGVVRTPINGGVDDSFGLEIDTSGNIYVAGFTTLPFTLTLDMVLIKYTNTGVPVANFGTGGIVTFNNSDFDVAGDLKIQSDNKIVVAGASGLGFFGPRSAAVWRYLPNGNADSTFGANGFVTTDVFPTFQDYNAMALQSDGKIICAGRTNNGTQNDMVVVRYQNDLFTQVNEVKDASEFSIYPNPVSAGQMLTIHFNDEHVSVKDIILSDITGKKIKLEKAAIRNNSFTIKVPNCINAGFYLLSINTGKSTAARKVFIYNSKQ